MKRPHITFSLTEAIVESAGGEKAISDNLHGLFPGLVESSIRALHLLDPSEYDLQHIKPDFIWHPEGSDKFEFTCLLYTKTEAQQMRCNVCSDLKGCSIIADAVAKGYCEKSK